MQWKMKRKTVSIMDKMKISTFIHVYDNKVWNAVTKEFLNLSQEDIDFIKYYKDKKIDNNVNIPDNLLKQNIVISERKEKLFIEELKNKTSDKQIQSLYLIISTACNLDCDYCFYRSSASNSLKHKQLMDYETTKKALLDFKRIVSSNVKDNNYWQQITFYGGEPLLNRNLLNKAIPFARTLFDDSTNLVINTNAVLLENSDIQLFKDNDVEVQISIDGDREKHDLHRKTQDGEPTYQIVMNNIKKLLKNNVKVLPMITATDDNLDGFANRLYSIVSELGINDYAVNVLITNSFETSDNYSEKLALEMLKAYNNFGDKANDTAFVELYNRLLGTDKTIAKGICGSARKITVFPDGKIYACQALEKVKQNYMNTLDDDYMSNDNWNCWKNRSRFDNVECQNCGCVMSCGGGCATGSYNLNGSIYDIDKNNCEYTKKLFKEIHHI